MFGGSRSIILELQEAATDKRNDISDLLRKCLLVATKLKLDEFKQWINWELQGYDETSEDVPKYRMLRGEIRVFNPYHGLQPLYMPPEMERQICNIKYRAPIGNAVSVVEHQRNRSDSKSSPLFPLPSELKQYLLQHMELPLEPIRTVSETQLDMLIDAVRSTILEWSLKLEEAGIMGEGMTFSKEEKQIAAASQQIHIGNFQGTIGDIQGSTVTQNLTMHVISGDFQSLKKVLKEKGVSDADLEELEAAVAADPQPETPGQFGTQVSNWLGKMLTKAASGTWQIGTAAAGGLLSSAIGSYYGF